MLYARMGRIASAEILPCPLPGAVRQSEGEFFIGVSARLYIIAIRL
jgi:hypothetical protein